VHSSPADLDRWQRIALIVGIVGLVCCLLAGVLGWQQQVFRSYLVAFVLFTGIGLGCLAILMIQYLTGGTWGFVLRRPLEAGTRTLPLLAVLFLPLILGLSSLYDWAQPARVEESPNLLAKAPYLNVPFFVVRAVVYFAIWNGLMYLFNAWSRQQDATRDQKLVDKCEALSGPGLVLFAITVTFAAIDWMMSLEPSWYSSIYGPMVGWGFVLSAFAFCLATLLLLRDQPPLASALARDTLGELATLLLAFVMVWAYLSLMQFLLIWSGNLPEEVPWYQRRLDNGWSWIGLALMVLHFALPFVVLLSHNYRRNPRLVLGVVALVLFMRIIDVFWLIVPAYQPTQELWRSVHLLDLAALVGVGGVWLGVFLWQMRQAPLLPLYRPGEETTHHG
jgi:hypothetical protein